MSANARPRVAFVAAARTLARFLPSPPACARDVDAAQQGFRSGEDVWAVQSYALLRETLVELGFDVTLGETFPPGALCVAHWDALNRYMSGAHRARVIGVRADRPPLFGCECVVVQNNLLPETAHRRYVPLWPQPGLIARDPARGDRVERIAHFGRTERVPGWMSGTLLRERLAAIGATLVISEQQWNDYRDVDAVLSVRTESPLMLAHKPASKLANAWLAGVPAMLGDEPAYRALRRSDDDYVAVASADDVVGAIERWRREPARYRSMIANGLARSVDFTREAIARRWVDVIRDVSARTPPRRSWLRYASALTRQKLEAKRFRRLHAVGQQTPATGRAT